MIAGARSVGQREEFTEQRGGGWGSAPCRDQNDGFGDFPAEAPTTNLAADHMPKLRADGKWDYAARP